MPSYIILLLAVAFAGVVTCVLTETYRNDLKGGVAAIAGVVAAGAFVAALVFGVAELAN
jgi:hypothetical protein